VAKLGKAFWDACNQGGWLISLDLFKNWIAEGVPSEINDTSYRSKMAKEYLEA